MAGDLNGADLGVLDRGNESDMDHSIGVGADVLEDFINSLIEGPGLLEDIEMGEDLFSVNLDIKYPLAFFLHVGLGEPQMNLVLAR